MIRHRSAAFQWASRLASSRCFRSSSTVESLPIYHGLQRLSELLLPLISIVAGGAERRSRATGLACRQGRPSGFFRRSPSVPRARDLTLLTARGRFQGISKAGDDNIHAHSFPPQGPAFVMKVGPLCLPVEPLTGAATWPSPASSFKVRHPASAKGTKKSATGRIRMAQVPDRPDAPSTWSD
jgi:hypothetical protein